jgi:hypothetical protein
MAGEWAREADAHDLDWDDASTIEAARFILCAIESASKPKLARAAVSLASAHVRVLRRQAELDGDRRVARVDPYDNDDTQLLYDIGLLYSALQSLTFAAMEDDSLICALCLRYSEAALRTWSKRAARHAADDRRWLATDLAPWTDLARWMRARLNVDDSGFVAGSACGVAGAEPATQM